jgi:hypothetical protein
MRSPGWNARGPFAINPGIPARGYWTLAITLSLRY